MAKIINIGALNIDYVYTVPHFVRAGESLVSHSLQVFPGGKGLNQSIAMARAGMKVTHAGMVGNDGVFLLDVLSEAGVDTTYVKALTDPTGHAIIQVTSDGQNCILLYSGANKSIDEQYINSILELFTAGDILVLQNEVSCVTYTMQAAHKKGLRIAFNPSPFGEEVHLYPLDTVTWFLLNEIEGYALTGILDPDGILEVMGRLYPKSTIVLTMGENGALCLSDNNLYRQNAYSATVVDTTAAGDTFTGYFIYSVAMGMEVVEALDIASKAAAITVSRWGAAASIPKIEEVIIK